MDDRRYFGLDALRGAMMMLGIVLHAAMLYLVSPPVFMPTDPDRHVVFDTVFDFIHSFRMPTFFVLAGFFTCLLVEKRGVAGTYRNRAARILAPFAASIVTILPLTLLFWMDFMLDARFGTHRALPDPEALQAFQAEAAAHGMPVDELPIAHLWFLYYLCFFYLLIPACRWIAACSERFGPLLRRLALTPVLWIVLALYTSATLWPFSGGQVHEGFIYFRPHLPSLVYYGSFFVLGYLLHGFRDLFSSLARSVAPFAVLAGVLFPLSLYASALDRAAGGHDAALHLFAVLANGACTWALVYFFIGIALRHLDRDSPWIVYTSQSSYWVFLVHMPLVCIAGWWLLQFQLPAGIKFLLVCAFTVAVAFSTFHYLVQRSWISQFLYGRRFDLRWPWQRDPAPAAA